MFKINKNKDLIKSIFQKSILGYHLINSTPINEKIWEDINALIFSNIGIKILQKSEGSHLSGMDIDTSIGKFSNKSAKYSNDKTNIDISSYRLTTVCSEKNCGKPKDIKNVINQKKNFDYYSIIVRDECSDFNNITYDWFIIPSNYKLVNPYSYTWKRSIGKKGKNKNSQIGWKTNQIDGSNMIISFSMSSQLWIHLKITKELKKFIVASTKAPKKPKYDYIKIYNKIK